MKIKPFLYAQKNNFAPKKSKHINNNHTPFKYSDVKINYFPLMFTSNFNDANKTVFNYQIPSGVKPIREYFNSSYENLNEFSVFFADKLNSQLMPISSCDVENLINKIQNKTQTSKEQVLRILFRLSRYSNYKALDNIQYLMQKNNVGEFWNEDNGVAIDFSTNQSLKYLQDSKLQIFTFGNKKAIVLDDIFLKQLQEFKTISNKTSNVTSEEKEKAEVYLKLLADIKKDKIVFFNLCGWDVLCSDGKYRSANMFSGTGYIEALAIDIIKRIQNGENENEIFYGDFSRRLAKILKDDIQENKILIKKDEIGLNVDFDDVCFNLSTKVFDSEIIKEKIEEFVALNVSLDENTLQLQSAICKYLDEFSTVYSVDRLALELKQLKKAIDKKVQNLGLSNSMVKYIIPEENKSFGLITNMFARINNVSPKNISGYIQENNNGNQVKIVLDDLTISGITQSSIMRKLRPGLYENDLEGYILYCVLNAGISEKTKMKQDDKNFLININQLKSFLPIKESRKTRTSAPRTDEKTMELFFKTTDVFTKKDYELLREYANFGYKSSGVSCALPYMIPDNCSNVSAEIFGQILHKDNVGSNKARKKYSYD